MRREPPVEGHEDGADSTAGQVHEQLRSAVERKHGHSVAAPYPAAAAQKLAVSCGLRIEPRVGPALPGCKINASQRARAGFGVQADVVRAAMRPWALHRRVPALESHSV